MYISSKLVFITNMKSYMSFRLVPKLVTLNYLEPGALRKIVGYVYDVVVKKFTFAISSPDVFLVKPWFHVKIKLF